MCLVDTSCEECGTWTAEYGTGVGSLKAILIYLFICVECIMRNVLTFPSSNPYWMETNTGAAYTLYNTIKLPIFTGTLLSMIDTMHSKCHVAK